MEGIHTALTTPFLADGSLDLPAFERSCRRQVDAGIHGLVPCGTTGEAPTLERDEWTELVRAAVRVAAGRVPVTAGVGTNNTRTTLANCEAAAALGASAGLLVLPYYNKPDPRGLAAHVKAAAGVGLPLVLYHVPGRTGQHLPVAQLAELAAVPGVVAVKEATGDLRYGTDLVRRTEVAVLSGDDFTFLGLALQGGRGCVSVVSNAAPAETVAIWNDAAAGHNALATAGLHRLWELVGFLFAEPNPVPIKAVMEALGLGSRLVRPPLGTSVADPLPVLARAGLAGSA